MVYATAIVFNYATVTSRNVCWIVYESHRVNADSSGSGSSSSSDDWIYLVGLHVRIIRV